MNVIVDRLVHLDVEDTSEEFLGQLSYAIKNQLVTSKAPCSSLVLYGIRIGVFHAQKGPIIGALMS